jgi:hypothetical protein
MKYNLVKIEKSEYQHWDKLVDESNEGTIFHKVIYLKAMNINFKIYYVMKAKIPVAGISLSIDPLNKKKTTLQDYLIYNGLIFFNMDYSQSNVSKIHSMHFEITDFVVNELIKKYDTIEFQMSPGIKDIRPFMWLNYHSKDANKKFKVDVRYTSNLNIDKINDTDILNDNQCFSQLGTSRRQQIRYGIKNKIKAFESNKSDEFFSIYNEIMKDRVEPNYLEKLLKTTKSIIEGMQRENALKVYYAENYRGYIVSSALFCWDLKRAYYLFGANNPSKEGRFIGSYMLWEAFKNLRKSGIKEIDLEGVNSPDRGSFKLSFGGDLSPYYKLQFGSVQNYKPIHKLID